MKRNEFITLRLPAKHKKRLSEIANKYDCTVSDILNIAIRRYLKNETRRERIERERQQTLNSENNKENTDNSKKDD